MIMKKMVNVMNNYSFYTTEYISGVMSLRTPQKESLNRLENIINNIDFTKQMNLQETLLKINKLYPTCTDFERDFASLTFALATGVGKTRLMGAFIAYLYTNYNIRNFFVVAPNTTIYEKLKLDLSYPSNPKYVFKGLGCFSQLPNVITDDDYRNKAINLYLSDINIYIYNISKFDKENTKMKSVSEYWGQSFYQELSKLDDLVLIMDESHNYRAKKGWEALNDLNPLLGLELTATPFVKSGSKQIPFKNVVYEYSLAQAIEDGYVRTPYALTRADIDFYNFGDEQLDKLMISDGIAHHEYIKQKLLIYAKNNNKRIVKPFVLIVCKNIEHAQWIEKYITSSDFKNGYYVNKVITIHSKNTKIETDENLKKLLDVEKTDNPIEIVIHVNSLKEGWDVNNLYTIIPLRTATSKILREQMIGRGLRLPYGERTGDKEIDAVVLTAHDKFKDILEEAQKGDSIFNAKNIIKAEDLNKPKEQITQPNLNFKNDVDKLKKSLGFDKSNKSVENMYNNIRDKINDHIEKYNAKPLSKQEKNSLVQNVITNVEKKDLGETFFENKEPLMAFANNVIDKVYKETVEKYIPIPHIKVAENGVQDYKFTDFDLNLDEFNHTPIENTILIQNLKDAKDTSYISGQSINFEGYNPKKELVSLLREKPEIDYETVSDLLFKLITQVYQHYTNNYGELNTKNIIMMYKRDIADKIYNQMMKHFSCNTGFIEEAVSYVSNYNLKQTYVYSYTHDLYDNYKENIKSILFNGINKGVFSTAKFDSYPELLFARIIENDATVKNWLRPANKEFNITYNNGKRYIPDFVVETTELCYLVEIKGEDKINNPDVIAKRNRAVTYCEVASNWAKANNYKTWKHLFIPANDVQPNIRFEHLAKRFLCDTITK